MTETSSELVSHRVALLYECRMKGSGAAGAVTDVTFDQVAATSGDLGWIDPARLAAGAQRSLAGTKIWQHGPLTVSHDLHPAIRSILTSTPKGQTGGDTPGCYRLTDRAQNLMTGFYVPGASTSGTRNRGFTLNLGPKAAGRIGLGDRPEVTVLLEEAMFLCFRTDIGIAVVEVSIEIPSDHPKPLALLIEATHLLSDERRPPLLTWQAAPGSTEDTAKSKSSRFHLSDLLRPLLKDGGYDVIGGRRMFSYSTIVTGSELPREQRQEVAFRLSRHYNYTYAPQMADSGTELIEPFNNVLHGLSLEGAASVVALPVASDEDGSLPEFLTNWLETAYRPAYLPLVIVAYHEHIALLDFAQSAAIDLDFDSLEDEQISRLQRLCHRFLAFRLRYRPAQVSFITMHNQFSVSLRRALGSDALSQKAAQDAIEAEMRLSRHVAELDAAADEAERRLQAQRLKAQKAAEFRSERHWAWHSVMLASLVAILAVLNFGEQLSKIIEPEMQAAAAAAVPATEWSWPRRIQVGAFIVAILCGIAGGYVNWIRGRHGHEDESVEELKSDVLTEPSGRGRRIVSERDKLG